MSWLDGFDEADAINLDNRIQRTDKLPDPGFLHGDLLGEAGKGLKLGGITASNSAQAIGAALLEQDLLQSSVYFPEADAESQIQSLQEEQERLGRDTAEAVEQLRPDPRAVGLAGQLLSGAAEILPRTVAAYVAAGPAGVVAGPLAGGVPSGYAAKRSAMAKGVDESTATGVGLIEGATTTVGIGMPGARLVKSVAGDLAAVGAANVGLGVAQRGATAELLERNGYAAQAAQYRAFDGSAMAIDAVMGVAFGALGRAGDIRSAMSRSRPTAEQVDAALTMREALHFEEGAAPGAPVDPQSANVHRTQLAQAIGQLSRGEQVTVVDGFNANFLRRPADLDPIAPTRAEAVAMARAELEPVVRTELEAESVGTLPNVADVRAELAGVQRTLAGLDDTYRDRAKQAQADGMSRKKAEATARQTIEQERQQLTDRVTTLEESLAGNRSAEISRGELAALARGETPERLQQRINERADQIQQAFERNSLARQVDRAKTPEQVVDSDIDSLLEGLGLSLRAKDLSPHLVEPSVTTGRQPVTRAAKPATKPAETGTAQAKSETTGQPAAEPKLSPESSAELDILRESVARQPDAMINSGFDADGNPTKVRAADALVEVEAEYQAGVKESRSFMAAITCMLRG